MHSKHSLNFRSQSKDLTQLYNQFCLCLELPSMSLMLQNYYCHNSPSICHRHSYILETGARAIHLQKKKKRNWTKDTAESYFGSRYLIESWHQSHRPLKSLCMRHLHLCPVSHPHTWTKKPHTTLSGSFAAQCLSLVRKPTKKDKPFIESITLFSVFLRTRLRWALLSHCKCQSAF